MTPELRREKIGQLNGIALAQGYLTQAQYQELVELQGAERTAEEYPEGGYSEEPPDYEALEPRAHHIDRIYGPGSYTAFSELENRSKHYLYQIYCWTNDNYDHGYPSETASWFVHYDTLKDCIDHVGGPSRTGFNGCQVDVYLNDVLVEKPEDFYPQVSDEQKLKNAFHQIENITSWYYAEPTEVRAGDALSLISSVLEEHSRVK